MAELKIHKNIDLLPQASEEEIQKVEKKSRINLSGVFFVFVVVMASVIILALNWLAQNDLDKAESNLAQSEQEIRSYEYIELKQRSLNNKIETYKAANSKDFNSDKVINYLLDIVQGLGHVEEMYVDEDLNFSIDGDTDSYINLARIWHDMSQQEDYFQTIDLSKATLRESEENADRVKFSFSGKMIKENVDDL